MMSSRGRVIVITGAMAAGKSSGAEQRSKLGSEHFAPGAVDDIVANLDRAAI